MKATPEQLEALAEQLELARQRLELECEQFEKFVRPAMHCFGKLLPELPLYMQAQFRALRAQELRELVEVYQSELVVDGVDKLRRRIETLLAQCAQS